MTEPARGTRLLDGRYEISTTPLARGGMGEVYEGRDVRLEREVAVKFIRFPADTDEDERKDMVRRFVRESRITAELQHPGVPAVFDAGSGGDMRPYLVMQRIHGVSVADLIAEQERLSVGWSAGIAAQVCSVLAAAHRASLVHRDLKPGNLMLEPTGTVKVLDFGLAVALDRADLSQITRTGHTPGTPSYMAPEQLMAGKSTRQSDLYALGCVLHEMLTGKRLFTASTSFAVASKQASEKPVEVRSLRPDVPRELSEVIDALLEKRPDQRPRDAVEVYGQLIGFANDLRAIPGILHPPSRPNPHRMYGAALARIFDSVPVPVPAMSTAAVGEPSAVPVAPETGSQETQEVQEGPEPQESREARKAVVQGVRANPVARSDIDRARAEVAELVGSSRYRQAADTLRDAVSGAAAAFGGADSEVVGLRVEWANVLFEGGDFRQAGPVYAELAAELADESAHGSEADRSLVFRCRLQNATCQALTGDTARALELLQKLLGDEVAAFGPDDHRPLELRRQIGLLELGAGQRTAAEHTLSELRDDLLRLHGPDHPAISQIGGLLESPPSGP